MRMVMRRRRRGRMRMRRRVEAKDKNIVVILCLLLTHRRILDGFPHVLRSSVVPWQANQYHENTRSKIMCAVCVIHCC